jgi:osmotically inducible lipoprotein OsmB
VEALSQENEMSFLSNTSMAAFSLTAVLMLSACGTTPGERAASGGLIGAGGGAAVGAIAGHPVEGALIGGALGAVAGAVSDPCKFNLGDPFWKNTNASREDYYQRCGHYPR